MECLLSVVKGCPKRPEMCIITDLEQLFDFLEDVTICYILIVSSLVRKARHCKVINFLSTGHPSLYNG